MSDILRSKFDTILLFALVVLFAGLSIRYPVFMELDKEVLAAFLALISRDVIARVKNGNGNAPSGPDS